VRKFWRNNLSIPIQFANVKKEYPQFKVSMLKDSLLVKGELQPTPRSNIYHFKLKYSVGVRPKIKITNPELKRNFKNEKIPHVYAGNELCLYYPQYKEFDSKCKISDYIIPWISLWLYYYEIWHITGEWLGGGIHPIIKEKNPSP
jgi:hypothetical protein